MKTVALIVTGDAEKALSVALKRIFSEVEFRAPIKLDGFTSAELPEVPRLEERRPTNVERLAAKLVAEVEPGRRDKPADLVILIDDLELCNQARPARVVEHVRRAVERYIERYDWPSQASRDRARDRVRERCSFHLLDPMVEAYFFGEGAALTRAGAVRPSTLDPRVTDVERFVVGDADFLAREDNPPGEKTPPWARPQRANHPKAYLQFLCDPSGTLPRAYRESGGGREALKLLDWNALLAPEEHVRFLRSLILDIADRFGELGVASRFPGEAHPLTWPGSTDRVLRNI